jgi:hypothetical protein
MNRTKLPFVIIASPLAGDVEANTEYAQRAVADSLRRGEAPFAPHLLYPAALEDTATDRKLGMQAGLAAVRKADIFALYVDRGISQGMRAQLELARGLGIQIERRVLGELPIAVEPAAEVEPKAQRRNSIDLG